MVRITTLRRNWLHFNSLLDDYNTAVFLAHPLYQPLGLQMKANTDGGETVEAIGNTFVYTVLLMLVMGTTMYLVYGRLNRNRRKKPSRPIPPQRLGGDAGAPGTAGMPDMTTNDSTGATRPYRETRKALSAQITAL